MGKRFPLPEKLKEGECPFCDRNNFGFGEVGKQTLKKHMVEKHTNEIDRLLLRWDKEGKRKYGKSPLDRLKNNHRNPDRFARNWYAGWVAKMCIISDEKPEKRRNTKNKEK